MFLGRHAETDDERSIKAKHLDDLAVETARTGRRIRIIAEYRLASKAVNRAGERLIDETRRDGR